MKMIVCPRCKGKGKPNDVCVECKGKNVVPKPEPEPEDKDYHLESLYRADMGEYLY